MDYGSEIHLGGLFDSLMDAHERTRTRLAATLSLPWDRDGLDRLHMPFSALAHSAVDMQALL